MIEPCHCVHVPKSEASNEVYRVRETKTYQTHSAEEIDRIFARYARHEAGHVVSYAARGIVCERATIGGSKPHARFHFDVDCSLLEFMTHSQAGSIAEWATVDRDWRPSWTYLMNYIKRAREGQFGVCDRCHEAGALVHCFPDLDDADIVERWFVLFDSTAAYVASESWARAIDALTTALLEKTLLERDEIEAILSKFDLSDTDPAPAER
jgi:hypothetical protein